MTTSPHGRSDGASPQAGSSRRWWEAAGTRLVGSIVAALALALGACADDPLGASGHELSLVLDGTGAGSGPYGGEPYGGEPYGGGELPGCDGVPGSGATYDACGVCSGDGTSCSGCDGVPYSAATYDACGICGGDGSSCAGCDGVPNSGATYDSCGVCNGDGSSCAGCDGVPNSGAVVDACGVCGGDGSSCAGCDGVPNSGRVVDACGVCNGDGSSCAGCDGVPNSGAVVDACGVCGGDGTSCCAPGCSVRTGYHLYCPSNAMIQPSWCPESESCGDMDQCQATQAAACDAMCPGGCVTVYDGPPSCCDCPTECVYDACGVCNGDGSTCAGCDGVPNSGKVVDACGVCGGDGSSCCAPGCEVRTGYHLYCPTSDTIAPSWCPESDTCGAMDQCQAAQAALCDAACPGGCVTVYDGPPSCCDCPTECVPDACGVCNGDGSSCTGCDGVPGSGAVPDACGVCGGDGSTCVGCDGEPGSGKVADACGVCDGDGSSCAGCDGVPMSGLTYDVCGICDGPHTDDHTCPDCDGVPGSGLVYDACGVCGGDGTTCAGCDGVPGSGLVYDECGACGGDGSSCIGCDGVVGSGLVYDDCGVCGGPDHDDADGDGDDDDPDELEGCQPPPPPPPPPAREYVMSIYFVPADGATGNASLLNNGAYTTPFSLLTALGISMAVGSAHVNQGLARVGHEVGHAYVNFFSRKADGTDVQQADPDIFPTGQTGGGAAEDFLRKGAGGTILGIYPGRMNTVAEAQGDIDKRIAGHGRNVIVRGPRDVIVWLEANAQLIGRADFILTEETWNKVKERSKIHARETSSRYGLLLEPAIKSRQVGETGGEGAGCTSYASLMVVYSGAIKRTVLNPVWTRHITFGERTIARGYYRWGSHLRAPWPVANIRNTHWWGDPAATYLSQWTWPNWWPDWDRTLHRVSMNGLESPTNHRTLTGYWYDPDYMYFWARGVYEAARQAPGATAASLGRTWKAKTLQSADAVYPYIETDARDAVAQSTTWDTALDPYNTDWGKSSPFEGGRRFSLRDSRGCYVRAVPDAGRNVDSRGAADGPWEKFTAAAPNLASGDVISWWSFMSAPVTAENGGGANVVHNRIDPGPWERWTLRKVNGAGQPVAGAIASGDRVALQAASGHWLVAENAGCGALNANRAALGPWETFTITFH